MSRPRLPLDSSGLIALARLGLLPQVDGSVGEVSVVPEVVAETTHGDRPGARAINDAIRVGHVRVLEGIDIQAIAGLGSGEIATILQAERLGMTAVIDDPDARRVAARRGVSLTGTVAILVRLAQVDGQVSLAAALDDLDRFGFRVAPAVRAWALGAVGPGAGG